MIWIQILIVWVVLATLGVLFFMGCSKADDLWEEAWEEYIHERRKEENDM